MIDDLIRRIPKAELHLHIEGTLEPEMMLQMAARNQVRIRFTSAEEARGAYRFDDLSEFLKLYFAGMEVLRTQRDFYDLTLAYLRRAAADGVRHAEVFFDAQNHLRRGVPFADILHGIASAFHDAERELRMSGLIFMAFVRDEGPESAMETLELALPFRELLAGVGLASNERGHPPRDYVRVYERARSEGLALVAHAGEEGSAACVAEAVDLLKVRRVDHGVHAADDPRLVRRLADERIPLTMCPISNLRLGVVSRLEEHPLKRLLDAGVVVTVNSDDPAYFGGYVAENYHAAQQALALSVEDIHRLARNSVSASLLPESRRAELLDDIDTTLAAWLEEERAAS